LGSNHKNGWPDPQIDDDRGCARKAGIGDTDAAALEACGRRQRLLGSVVIMAVMVPGMRTNIMNVCRRKIVAARDREPTDAAKDKSKRQQDCEDRSSARSHGCENKRLPLALAASQAKQCTIYRQCCLFAAITRRARIAVGRASRAATPWANVS
jgi:hypothetical protein